MGLLHNKDILSSIGAACTTIRPVMGKLSITASSSSDGAFSTESTSGSFAIHGATDGDSEATLSFNAVSTNAESKNIPPTPRHIKRSRHI